MVLRWGHVAGEGLGEEIALVYVLWEELSEVHVEFWWRAFALDGSVALLLGFLLDYGVDWYRAIIVAEGTGE